MQLTKRVPARPGVNVNARHFVLSWCDCVFDLLDLLLLCIENM